MSTRLSDSERSLEGDGHDVGSDRLEEFVDRHPGVVTIARVGWAAKGVVYVLIGLLAFTVAADPFGWRSASGSGEADPSGAIATIARQPFGTVLLWAVGIGLLLYALWRLVTVVLPADLDAHAVLRRVGYTVSAATYVVLGLSALSLALHPGSSGGGGAQGQSSQSQDSQVTTATNAVMEWTGGRWIVGVAGVVVVGIGGYFLWKAATASFEKQLERRSVGPLSWNVVRNMGRVGWIGRAVMMGLIGVFVTRAAIQFDPDEARGLDDSLRRVADDSFGMVLVLVVALGLVLYGGFCIVSAPLRKLVPTDED